MKKKIPFQKTSKALFIAFFLCFLTLPSGIYSQGPNAAEAASFEPVDATDMVNLVTGNLSYVLPILNVPSPEGGYPISLSYHAGIAMEQEASWVGLGWNINPGSINRAVNGYPDDWGKTKFTEFFYDKGWTEDYYSFSAGITFGNGVSAGLGLSWGSNQSLSGSVSLGIGGSFIDIGGNGINAGVGIGGASGLNFSLATNGVGVGYGLNSGGSSALGVNLNFNPNSGLSGGISGNSITGFSKNGNAKISGLGISFNSRGASVNGKINGVGAGISNSSSSISGSDYDINVKSSGFSIPLGVFYVGYNHTKVKYSLFKKNNLYTSGIINPYLANNNILYDNGNTSPYLNRNNSMDVDNIAISTSRQHFTFSNIPSVLLPGYDNYTVTAQGMSGNIAPYSNKLILSSKSIKTKQVSWWDPTSTFPSWQELFGTYYMNNDITEFAQSNLIRKRFTFQSTYNSFLRIETSKIKYSNDLIEETNSSDFFQKVYTQETTNYTNQYSNNKKREGNFIVTYSNKEIRNGNINNYFEAKSKNNLLDRNDTDIFLDEGIGAYQITSLDGKTYHYSLPVYQYESVYKNFKDKNDEHKNFFEIEKSSPYATHWLLTAITGPDYYDKNNNGRVDEADYGYWVEFEYGKWSDGFAWRTPNGNHYDEIINENDETENTYSYSIGRKQVYYLDAIKTRTHTALFVKEIREDNKSFEVKDFISKAPYDQLTNTFSIDSDIHAKEVISAEHSRRWGVPASDMFTSTGNEHTLPFSNYGYWYKNTRRTYKDIPFNYSLKLNKIILLNNKKYNYNSNLKDNDYISGSWTQHGVGAVSETRYGYENLLYGYNEYPYPQESLYFEDLNTKVFRYNIGRNILDEYDIGNTTIESLADQVISLDYDYNLAYNAPNANTGRLSLKNVNFKGKQGIQMIPPYRFSYNNSNTNYNNDEADSWGYHKTNPSVWSLNEITTPTGGKIKIEYEPDSYYAEAASQELIDLTATLDIANTKKVYSIQNDLIDFTKYYEEGSYFKLNSYEIKIKNVSKNQIEIYEPLGSGNEHLNNLIRIPKDYIFELNDLNGKTSGGIRVKRISVTNNLDEVSTNYSYTDFETGKTSGITSFSPENQAEFIPFQSLLPPPLVMYNNVSVFNKDKNGNIIGKTQYNFETLKVARYFIRNFNAVISSLANYYDHDVNLAYSLGEPFAFKILVGNDSNTTQKQFKITYLESGESSDNGFGRFLSSKYEYRNNLGILGRIKSIKSFNAESHLLNKTENFYKKDLDNNGEIGVTQESHINYKRNYGGRRILATSTSTINYPSVLESIKTTQGNFNVTKYFDKYDFLTGQVLETRTYASDGIAFKTKNIPAYEKYPLMGSKIDDINNKNMLTQLAANYTYLLDEANNTESIISAGITTWNNEWNYRKYDGTNDPVNSDAEKVWRKHKSFVWKGDIDSDGMYVDFTGEDDGFVWGLGLPQTNNNWQQASEVTKYDHYSMSLEVKDINNNYASTKMGDSDSKVLSVSNSVYTEMYYSGAEYVVEDSQGTSLGYFDGEIKSTGVTPSTTAHTGDYIVSIGTGQNAFEVEVPARAERNTTRKQRFKVSVWVRTTQKDNVKINVGGSEESFSANETQTAGSWTLLNGYINIPATGTIVALTSTNGTIDLDDFRLHPISSSMTSYVYNEFDEVTFITGANGLSTSYVYDHAGRLKETWVEVIDNPSAGITGGFKKTQQYRYNYKNL